MPSPFPGMDPYLEDWAWEDFHLTFNTVIRELLQPALRPRYAITVEQRLYIENGLDGPDLQRIADVADLWTGNERLDPLTSSTKGSGVMPVECLVPSPWERRETFLVIREMPSLEVVTVIETLSPANKRQSGDGRRQYLAKREELLNSGPNFVELDFLRGGARPPLLQRPPGDYYALIMRANRPRRADVYAWSIRQPMPEVPVPLKPGEPESMLDLQHVFEIVYDRADYGLRIDYSSELLIPLSEADAEWKRRVVKGPAIQ